MQLSIEFYELIRPLKPIFFHLFLIAYPLLGRYRERYGRSASETGESFAASSHAADVPFTPTASASVPAPAPVAYDSYYQPG